MFFDSFEKITPKFIRKINDASEAARKHADDVVDKLLNGSVEEILAAKDEIKSNPKLMNNVLHEDRQEALREKGLKGVENSKGPKEIFYHFFGMNETWPVWRNLLGGMMVHSPEWPTYFIPAYTQAKATGDATDLKKGEGARGLITGGLEGIAVGALVSGRILKVKEMGPYIILGAALQLFSSKFFSWAGEKIGQVSYYKTHPKPGGNKTQNPLLQTNFVINRLHNPVKNPPAFKSKSLYNTNSSNRMKV